MNIDFTALGSLPGSDMGAALRLTFDNMDFPYLPELPSRGSWAAMLGRSLGLLVGINAEYEAGEWRLAATPGVDLRRARATLRDDLDQLQEIADGYTGRLKVQIAGPWTLAASTARSFSDKVLGDLSARKDLAQSLAAGVQELLQDLRHRFPQAQFVLQVDEPSLPAVFAGAIPTPGGFFRYRAISLPEIITALREVTAAAAALDAPAALHCCAPGLPLKHLLGSARDQGGFSAISLDHDMLDSQTMNELASVVDAGANLWLGILPTTSNAAFTPDQLRQRVLRFMDILAVRPAELLLTPACGMAVFSSSQVSTTYRVLAATVRQVREELAQD